MPVFTPPARQGPSLREALGIEDEGLWRAITDLYGAVTPFTPTGVAAEMMRGATQEPVQQSAFYDRARRYMPAAAAAYDWAKEHPLVTLGASLAIPAMLGKKASAGQKAFRAEAKPLREALKGSKVAEKGGKLKRVFHGTPAAFKQFDPAFKGSGAGGDLYGPGFYFTEAAEVAGEGYANIEKYGMTKTLKSGLTFDEVKDYLKKEHLIEGQGSMHPQRVWTLGPPYLGAGTRVKPENDIFGPDPRFRIEQPEINRPNVRPAFLNIKKPFDMDTTMSLSEAKNVLKQVGLDQEGIGKMLGATKYGLRTMNLYSHLTTHLATGKVGANQALKAAGYDGITHMGGAVMGDRSHRVWIAFEPEQIVGGFEPGAPTHFRTKNRVRRAMEK